MPGGHLAAVLPAIEPPALPDGHARAMAWGDPQRGDPMAASGESPLSGREHSVPELTGGGRHALVVDDELADLATKALGGGEMNGDERSKLGREQPASETQHPVVDPHEITAGEDD